MTSILGTPLIRCTQNDPSLCVSPVFRRHAIDFLSDSSTAQLQSSTHSVPPPHPHTQADVQFFLCFIFLNFCAVAAAAIKNNSGRDKRNKKKVPNRFEFFGAFSCRFNRNEERNKMSDRSFRRRFTHSAFANSRNYRLTFSFFLVAVMQSLFSLLIKHTHTHTHVVRLLLIE